MTAAVAAFTEAATTGTPPDPAVLHQARLLAAVRDLAHTPDPTTAPRPRS